jgi:hypothetical protein
MATENTQAALSEISAEGDVILVLSQNKRLHVCSVILRNASAYFENRLGRNWSEGQDLSRTNPKEVPLLHDDADAVEIICNVVHHRNDVIPVRLDPQKMFELAITVDTLMCDVALKHASMLWLKPSGNECLKDLGYLMGAAYILRNAEAFNDITLAMILRHKGSYLSMFQEIPGLEVYIPRDTMCKYQSRRIIEHTNAVVTDLLEERRNQMRINLQQVLFDGFGDAKKSSSECTCAWRSQQHLKYKDWMILARVDPKAQLNSSISEILERSEQENDPAIPQPWDHCASRFHHEPSFRACRNERLRKIREEKGLSLEYVRSFEPEPEPENNSAKE